MSDQITHPDLADALVRLADALDDRRTGRPAPSYLEMAVIADGLRRQLDELARMLVEASRAADRTTWADVGRAFGVTRQAAMRRWTYTGRVGHAVEGPGTP
ncbi:MAG TPA: hypothetical protein VGA13_05150 [Acidimicrobiales bacterium]